MALRFLVVALLAATASAFEIPASASRRSVLAKVAAAAPLAALAPAFADSNNDFLGAKGIDVKATDATDSANKKILAMLPRMCLTTMQSPRVCN